MKWESKRFNHAVGTKDYRDNFENTFHPKPEEKKEEVVPPKEEPTPPKE